MILDKIVNLNRYTKTDNLIKAALEFLYLHKEDTEMADGKYEIIKGEVTAFVVSKDTVDETKTDMEIHKDFMDIHYMLKGRECCYLADLPMDIESYDYDEKADITFFTCENQNVAAVSKGDFYAVWPYEPHKPLCHFGKQSESVKKIICKVKIDSYRG